MKNRCSSKNSVGNNSRNSTSHSASRTSRNANAYDLNKVGGHNSGKSNSNSPYDLNNAGFKK